MFAVLSPFLLAVVAGYLANPLVGALQARGLRRDRLVPGLYAAVALALVLAANLLVPWLIETVTVQKAKFPEYLALLRTLPALLEHEAARLPFGADTATRAIRAAAASVQARTQALPGTLLGLVPALMGLALVPFVMYFVLTEGTRVLEGFVRACPARHVEKVLSLICQVDEVLGNYVRGMLLEAAVVAAMTWAGLAWLGVRYPFEIGLISGLTNMIPYLGPVCGGLAGGAVAFFQFKQFPMVAKVFGVCAGVQVVDNWVVQPVIMRSAVELHPVLLIFSLLVGGEVFGFFGLLFAVPVVCILKEAGAVVYDWYIAEAGLKKSSFSRHALRLPYL